MLNELQTIHQIDKAQIINKNLFITGTVANKRPDDSCITPVKVGNQMVQKFFDHGGISVDDIILEPCAGKGGILGSLNDLEVNCKVLFNEIDMEKKFSLNKKFTQFDMVRDNRNSLHTIPYLGRNISIYSKSGISKVIMNPPFDNAHAFIQAAFSWIPKGGQIVSLFPKYSLAKLNTEPNTFLNLVGSKFFSVEDISFGCNYEVKVVLIHIIK